MCSSDLNNFGNNNYRPYPANGNNSYGNPNGNFGLVSEERMIEVEKATKDFMQKQFEKNKLFTRMMEEQSIMLRNISHQIENLNTEISSLQTRISNTETYVSNLSDSQTSLINKMAAKPETIKESSSAIAVVRVCTIFTNETKDASHAHAPHVTSKKVVSVGNVSTISAKKFKLPDSTTDVPSKVLKVLEM